MGGRCLICRVLVGWMRSAGTTPGRACARSSPGFGVSGFAAADNLTHLGATVTALDESDEGDRPEKAELLEILGATVRLGAGSTAVLPDDADVVVTSPGWRPDAPLLAQAAARGVPMWGEVELGWRLRDPEPPCSVAGSHRHQRQDHDGADARGDAARARDCARLPAGTSACRSSRR